MREAIAFIFLLLLIVMGWKRPYSSHLEAITGEPSTATLAQASARRAALSAPAAAAAPKDRSWMFEKSSLDGKAVGLARKKHD